MHTWDSHFFVYRKREKEGTIPWSEDRGLCIPTAGPHLGYFLRVPNNRKSIYFIRKPWYISFSWCARKEDSMRNNQALGITHTWGEIWKRMWLRKRGGFDLDMDEKNSLAFLSKIVYCPFQWRLAVLVFVYCHCYQSIPYFLPIMFIVVGQPHFSLSLFLFLEIKKIKKCRWQPVKTLEIRITKLIMGCVFIRSSPLSLFCSGVQERENEGGCFRLLYLRSFLDYNVSNWFLLTSKNNKALGITN